MTQESGLTGEEVQAMNQDLDIADQEPRIAGQGSKAATDELEVRAQEPEDKS